MNFKFGLLRIVRNIRPFLLLEILLTCAFFVGFCGFFSYCITAEQITAIESSYSVLASPSQEYHLSHRQYDDSWILSYTHNGTTQRQVIDYSTYCQLVENPTIVKSKNEGRAMGAIAESLVLPSKYDCNGNITHTPTLQESYCVLLVTCTNSPKLTSGCNLTFTASVDDVLSLHPDYPELNEITVILCNTGLDQTGHPLVVPGEQYVVWGTCGSEVYQYGTGTKLSYDENASHHTLYSRTLRPYPLITAPTYTNATHRWQLLDEEFPELLSPDDPLIDTIIHTVTQLRTVIPLYGVGTSGLNGLLPFHSELYYLTEGRDFSTSEIQQGVQVCIISEQIAERNALRIGDCLSLSLIHNDTMYSTNATTGGISFSINLAPDTCTIAEVECEIVGIYSGPVDDGTSPLYFPAYTIFIPETVMPVGTTPKATISLANSQTLTVGGESYGKALSILQTYTLNKGQENTFMEHLNNLGIATLFTISDNGYSHISPVLKEMRSDGKKLLNMCLAVELVLLVCVSLMYSFQCRIEQRQLLLLGSTRRWVHTYHITGILFTGLFACIIAFLLSVTCCDELRSILTRFSILSLSVLNSSASRATALVDCPITEFFSVFCFHIITLTIISNTSMLLCFELVNSRANRGGGKYA